MAVSSPTCHTYFSLCTPRLSSSKSSRNLALSGLQPLPLRLSNSNFFLNNPISCKHVVFRDWSCRPSLSKASFPAQCSASQDIGLSEAEAEKQHSSSLKSLMQVYREAILGGDEDMIAKVEAMICLVEKEKNELFQKVASLSEEISSGKKNYIRLQADFDNFRKRSDKERLTVRTDTQGEAIERLLPMVDNFERAKQHIKLETEKEKKINASYQGIYKQLVEIMRSLHVAAIPTVGKPFDPSLHEAIDREESSEFKEGIIIQELRRGFLLGDRLLRPAMVKVSSGPGKRNNPSMAEKSSEQPVTSAGIDNQ